MNPRAPIDPRLLEALSAYLDGKLTGAELAALEERLKREESLRTQLAELRAVRDSLRSLPSLKSPRPLTLTPAQAGSPARRPGAVSSRWMAFGSAFAVLAFAAVASFSAISRGSMMMATAPESEAQLQAAPGANRAADGAGAGSGEAATLAAPAAKATFQLPQPTRAATQEKSVAGGTGKPTETPAEEKAEGCGIDIETDAVLEPCEPAAGFTPLPAQKSFSLPDFQTLAPYLEGFLGLSAVILAVLAFVSRKRR